MYCLYENFWRNCTRFISICSHFEKLEESFLIWKLCQYDDTNSCYAGAQQPYDIESFANGEISIKKHSSKRMYLCHFNHFRGISGFTDNDALYQLLKDSVYLLSEL